MLQGETTSIMFVDGAEAPSTNIIDMVSPYALVLHCGIFLTQYDLPDPHPLPPTVLFSQYQDARVHPSKVRWIGVRCRLIATAELYDTSMYVDMCYSCFMGESMREGVLLLGSFYKMFK